MPQGSGTRFLADPQNLGWRQDRFQNLVVGTRHSCGGLLFHALAFAFDIRPSIDASHGAVLIAPQASSNMIRENVVLHVIEHVADVVIRCYPVVKE